MGYFTWTLANKELKERFKPINNLANDIMEKSNETR